jgi:O-antigen/teichoic acid export membrane protein
VGLINKVKNFFPQLNLGRKGSLRSHLIRGAFGSLILKIAATGMTMSVAVVLARLLGAKSFGIYAFSLSVTQILTVPAMLGLQALMVREVSAYNAKGAFPLMRGLLIRAWQGVLGTSLLLAILAGAAAYFSADHIEALELGVFWPALFLVPLTALIQVSGAALLGLGKIIMGQLPRLVIKNGLFIIFLSIIVLLTPISLSARYAISLQVIATFLAAGFIFIALFKALPYQAKQVAPEYKSREWLQSAMPMLLAGAMQILNSETAIVMLGVLGGAEDVGFFRVAQRGAELVPFGLLAVSMAIGPTVSILYTNGQMDRLQDVLTKSARAVLVFSLPVALFLMIGSGWLVPFVFGAGFAPAAFPLVLLCAGQLVNAAMGPVGLVLIMTGHERLTALGVATAAMVNVILCAILVPLWGAMGAALATSISQVVWNILLAIWLFQRLRLTSTAIGAWWIKSDATHGNAS